MAVPCLRGLFTGYPDHASRQQREYRPRSVCTATPGRRRRGRGGLGHRRWDHGRGDRGRSGQHRRVGRVHPAKRTANRTAVKGSHVPHRSCCTDRKRLDPIGRGGRSGRGRTRFRGSVPELDHQSIGRRLRLRHGTVPAERRQPSEGERDPRNCAYALPRSGPLTASHANSIAILRRSKPDSARSHWTAGLALPLLRRPGSVHRPTRTILKPKHSRHSDACQSSVKTTKAPARIQLPFPGKKGGNLRSTVTQFTFAQQRRERS
jgi:hypothetical protein